MTATVAELTPTGKVRKYRREEKNKGFTNDGSYESVERLLRSLAYKIMPRVQAIGASMDDDDVLQELHIAYLRAKETFDPSKGILFSSYMTTCCYRAINEVLRRSEVERRHLGLVRISELQRSRIDDPEDSDLMERLDVSDHYEFRVSQFFANNAIHVEGNAQMEQEAPMNADPAELLSSLQEMHIGMERSKAALARLSEPAKRVVRALIEAARAREDDNERLPRMTDILSDCGLRKPEERRAVRAELLDAFGVRV